MSTIIFLYPNIKEVDVFTNSLSVPFYTWESRYSIDLTNITRIGFVWENTYSMIPFGAYKIDQLEEKLNPYIFANGNRSYYWSDDLVKFLMGLNKPIQIDLITCELSSQIFKDELELLIQQIPGITFNYSIDQTGNSPNGNWIMESSNLNIEPLYFNSSINTWKHTLLYTRYYNSRQRINFNIPITLKNIPNSDLLKDISNVISVSPSTYDHNDHLYSAIKSDGTVITWGTNGYQNYGIAGSLGNRNDLSNGYISATNVVSVTAGLIAFAAIKSNGSVVAWGHPNNGGSIVDVSSNLSSGVTNITSALFAFAALKSNGSVITWGDNWNGTTGTNSFTQFYNPGFYNINGSGAVSSAVSSSLTSGVIKIFSTYFSFAALKSDGSVITWGATGTGGDSSSVASSLSSGVINIFANEYSFAALKTNGSVITWGYGAFGGDSSSVSSSLSSDVINIYNTSKAFAAIKSNGQVITWGDIGSGGNSSSVASSLSSGVISVFSNLQAFAALKSDGSVITWGSTSYGGSSIDVSANLKSDVIYIYTTLYAFAALKSDGSVVTWGLSSSGGNSTSVASSLNSGSKIINIFNTSDAFAAVKSDGSVITWGSTTFGGNTSNSGNSIVYSYAGMKNFIFVSGVSKPPSIPSYYSSSPGLLVYTICDYINQNITGIEYSINNTNWIYSNTMINTIGDLSANKGYHINIRAINSVATGESNGFFFKTDANGLIKISLHTSLSGLNLSGFDLSNIQISGLIPGPFSGIPLNLPSGNYKITSNYLGNFIVGPGINLSKLDLSGCDLSGCDLSGCDLSGTNLSGTNLFNTITGPFIGTVGSFNSSSYRIVNNYIVGPNLNLSNSNLSNLDLSGINLTGSNLSNSNLSYSNLSNSTLTKTIFNLSDLSGTNLFNVNLIGTNITNIYNKPINIDSNWTFNTQTNSIVLDNPSSDTIKNILISQIQNSQNLDQITIYETSDTFVNQTATLIKTQNAQQLVWSSQTNNIQITLTPKINSGISNFLINVIKQSDTNVTLPTINGSNPLFLLYFKALDSLGNSALTYIKPLKMDITIDTSANYVVFYKYTGGALNPNDYVVGRMLQTNVYSFLFTSNSNYGAIPTNSISLLTGGDPHIRPLEGPQYILPNDIKYVCLLDDKFSKLQINARVQIMKKSDFQEYIYSKDKFLKSKKLDYLFNFSYYREIYISIGLDYIFVNPDTLDIRLSSPNSKIRYIFPNPKTGIFSLIHKIQYPLFNTTKILKIFVDKYIITIMSDLNTDERHFINLEYYGTNNIIECNGAFISRLKIIYLKDILGNEPNYYYNEYFKLEKQLAQMEDFKQILSLKMTDLSKKLNF